MDRHLVVFDVNVYLDVAELVGEPFSWDRFEQLAQHHASDRLPHPTNRQIDALRAVAVSRSGRFIGGQPLEVWTSSHINGLVVGKAEERLSWDPASCESLLQDLVYDLVYELSGGGSMGRVEKTEGSPPLDNEDGRVFATAYTAPSDPEGDFCYRYCVTSDREFRTAAGQVSGEVRLLYPFEWVELTRDVRRKAGMDRMRPRPT